MSNEQIDQYGSPFHRKMAELPKRIETSICCWMDLLGFGSEFISSGWIPSEAEWNRVYERVTRAQEIAFRSVTPGSEFVLALNDAIVRCYDVETTQHLDQLGFWLRDCVLTHFLLNREERDLGLPGARCVISFGSRLVHGHDEFRFDDFVLNYTRPKPNELSNIARQTGNPTIISNPVPMQMNLAFSRAYLLDAQGSKVGLSGPNFYIDNRLFEFSDTLPSKYNSASTVHIIENDGLRLYAIAERAERYHFGFELRLPAIEVVTEKISAQVWQVVSFFPPDADVSEFKFDLINLS